MVTALMVRPDMHPSPTLLCDSREYLDRAVSIDNDCVLSASALPLEDGIAILCCEDAAIYGEKGNRRIGRRIIAGVFYIVGYADSRLVSLTDHDLTRFTVRFWEPELFTDFEAVDAWMDDLGSVCFS